MSEHSTDETSWEDWTIQPWEGSTLCAERDPLERRCVGVCGPFTGGWAAWRPNVKDPFAHGKETGEQGRALVIAALVADGADYPAEGRKDRP